MTLDDLDPNSYTFKAGLRMTTYSEFIKTTFAYSSSINMGTINHDLDILHIALGIAGEWIELNNELNKHKEIKDNLSSLYQAPLYNNIDLEKAYLAAEKELGDLCYYIQMAANLCNISIPINYNKKDHRAIENFTDAVKKKIFYKHEIYLDTYILDVWGHLTFIADYEFNKPIEYFIEQNKTKLMKRYPSGKFSSTDAAEKKDTL